MKKTQSKNTIGLVILSIVLLFVGETVFNFGLYWPVLLALVTSSRRAYWYVFLFGLLVTSVTTSSLGLASLLFILGIFVFSRLRSSLGSNIWLTGLLVMGLSFLTDKLLGLSWSVLEGLLNLFIVLLLWRLDYFSDEIHLK